MNSTSLENSAPTDSPRWMRRIASPMSGATDRVVIWRNRLAGGRGIESVRTSSTHGVLSDPAVDRIAASSLREVVLTDSVPLPERKRLAKITTLSVAPLIGEAIRRIHRGESVGALFSSEVSLTQEMVLWEDGAEGMIDTRDGEADDESARGSLTASAQAGDR